MFACSPSPNSVVQFCRKSIRSTEPFQHLLNSPKTINPCFWEAVAWQIPLPRRRKRDDIHHCRVGSSCRVVGIHGHCQEDLCAAATWGVWSGVKMPPSFSQGCFTKGRKFGKCQNAATPWPHAANQKALLALDGAVSSQLCPKSGGWEQGMWGEAALVYLGCSKAPENRVWSAGPLLAAVGTAGKMSPRLLQHQEGMGH